MVRALNTPSMRFCSAQYTWMAGPIYAKASPGKQTGHDDTEVYRLLSCAIASAKAARRRAMKPAIRIAATNSQTATAIGLST